jgi:hypothetical protein
VLLGLVGVACTSGPSSGQPIDHAVSMPPNEGEQVTFSATGSPPPPGARCPIPPRSEGGFGLIVQPTTGRAGSTVQITGNTPLVSKSGEYVGPEGKIGFWFNLPFREWEHAYFGDTVPRSNNGVPVTHLGEADVQGRCTYRVTFAMPNVPPGTYPLVAIEHGGGAAAAMGKPIGLHVTS